jgi:hypothetical protein
MANDVKTAFLYGVLTPDVHMVQSEGFVDLTNKLKVAFNLWTEASITELESLV